MIYGYARVSTQDQNLDTQIEQLTAFGCQDIRSDKVTGVADKKPALEELLQEMKAGDRLIITRVDRLGRNTVQLLQFVEELIARDISLYIMELGMEATHRNGKLFLTILSALAENEKELIKEKTREGIQIAKRQGKYNGRPRKYTERNPKANLAVKLYLEGEFSVPQILNSTGIGKTTLYRILQERGITAADRKVKGEQDPK